MIRIRSCGTWFDEKNITYNTFNERTMCGLIKALSNMHEKSPVSNIVFFVRKLVNTKLKEGMFVTNLVIQFNAILSPLGLSWYLIR